MNYFAHIFIGAEFSEIMPLVAKQIVKTAGKDFLPAANLFIVKDERVEQYSATYSSEIDIITQKDNVITNSLDENWEYNDLDKGGNYFVRNIYNKIITAYTETNNCNVMLHFPLYKKEAYLTAKAIYQCIASCGKIVIVDYLGYADDMMTVFEPSYTIDSPSANQVAQFKKDHKESLIPNTHFIAIQNTNSTGSTLNLTPEVYAHILSTLIVTFCNNYNEIFPPTAEYRDVIALGVSKLSLDKYLIAEYLFAKVTLHAIDKAKVNNSEIDIDNAYGHVGHLLAEKQTILSQAFKKVDSLKTHNYNDYYQEFREEIQQSIQNIESDLTNSFTATHDLTLKTAILAAMLSKTECALFSNTLYNASAITLQDLYNEALNYFVESNIGDFFVINEESIVNPIKELKDVSNKLINAQAQSKNYEEQLALMADNIEKAEKAADCYVENGYFHFGENKFRLLPNIDQEPLEKTYEAKETKVASIDLRSYFNPIRNQGSQGSCLAHTIASLFEYTIFKDTKKQIDLSEAFLYYNARKLDSESDISTEEDTGARYRPAMDSLVKYGIAQEKFCPYNENCYTQEPSRQAYEDAATRKLALAMNVNRTIVDIKSAISEGYPVAVSFSLMESFFQASDGYIPMPTSEEIEQDKADNKHSHHAMVIVGYDDKMRHFILRNSWGTNWGQDGYCYVPYEYVEDKRLCNFCCIITQVAQQAEGQLENKPSLKIDDTDIRIRYIIMQTAKAREDAEIQINTLKKNELSEYLERMKAMLVDTKNRDAFIENTEQILTKKKDVEYKLIQDKKAKIEGESKAFKKSCIKLASLTAAIIILLSVAYFVCRSKYLESHGSAFSFWWLIVPIVVLLIIAVVMIVCKYRKWREVFEIDTIELQNHQAEEIKLTKHIQKSKIKTFMAWLLLRDLQKVEANLFGTYTKMLSLVNNLREWYKEIASKDDILLEESSIPYNISLIDQTKLDAFYEKELKFSLAPDIDFCEDIANHQMDEEYLKGYKEKLEKTIIDNILSNEYLAGYNISKQLTADGQSVIAKNITKEDINKLSRHSDVFMWNKPKRGTVPAIIKIFMPDAASVKTHYLFDKYTQPTDHPLVSELCFFRMKSLDFDECVMFQNQENKTKK